MRKQASKKQKNYYWMKTDLATLPVLSPALTGEEIKLVQARLEQPFANLYTKEPKASKEEMLKLVASIYYQAGQKAESADQANLAKLLVNEMVEKFRGVTFTELSIALNNGIRGEYGSYFGINLVTFNFFIREFLKCENRKAALEKQKQHENFIPEPTEEEKKKIDADFWIAENQRISRYHKTGELNLYAPRNLLALYLESGKITISQTEMQQTLELAERKYYQRSQTEHDACVIAVDRKALRDRLDRIVNGNLTEADNDKIDVIACEITMKKYYDSLKPKPYETSK